MEKFILVDPYSAYNGEMVQVVQWEGDVALVEYNRYETAIRFAAHRSKLLKPAQLKSMVW